MFRLCAEVTLVLVSLEVFSLTVMKRHLMELFLMGAKSKLEWIVVEDGSDDKSTIHSS